MGPVTTVTHVHTIPGPGYTVCLVTVNCDSIDCDCVGDRAVTGAGLGAMVGTKYFLNMI